jgi:hypothetical protein
MSEAVAIKLCPVKQFLSIRKLKLHPNNPRQISKERLEELKQSIVNKGFYQPILVWKKGGVILAGNHRYLAVMELRREGYVFNSPDGQEDVLPVVIEDVDEKMAQAILFESNNHYAEWVEERLSKALAEAKASGASIDEFGFDPEYVEILLKAAVADANGVIDDNRKIDPVNLDDVAGAIGERDEFESIVLPKPVYEMTTELLGQIAKGINPEWKPGNSYTESVQALCQFAREKGIEELWMKKPSKSSKEKATKK